MTGSGTYPKVDGDILYAKDVNMAFYEGTLASALNYASITATSTATVVKALNTSRKSLLVLNNGSSTAYIGLSGVTTSTGYKLNTGDSYLFYTTEAVYAITASTSTDIRYLEAE